MRTRSKIHEFPFWANLVTLFPLLVWRSAYDSFHEPKWCLLSIGVGVLLLVRLLQGGPLFKPRTPLDLPACACLAITLIAWRWDAPDRWVSFMLWIRLVLVYFLYRWWVSGFACPLRKDSDEDPLFDLVLALLFGGCWVLKEWVLSAQPWGATQVWSWVVFFCLLSRWEV